MVSINYAFREISCKIVYYGPGLSGKTTNLQYVHQKVPGKTKGELISLATDADRTLYFDFLPINLGAIQGFATKFQLYTVPGQVYYNATRKLVLRGVDGLVFVADSQRAKMDENIESLNNLYENIKEYGFEANELPLVVQYNKRDLPEIMSIEELQVALNPRGLPYFEASAVNGTGVFDTLKMVIKLVLDKARKGSELGGEAGEGRTQATMAEAAPATVAPATPKPTPAPATIAARPAAQTVQPQTVLPQQVSAQPAIVTPQSAGAAPAPLAAAAPPTVAPAPVPEPAPVLDRPPPGSSAPKIGGMDIDFENMTAAPTVIPAAPSLKRASEPKKKRSFWRKLFGRI